MGFGKILQQTKQSTKLKKIAGFDIETCNNNKTFVCCSLISDEFEYFFTNKEDFISVLKTKQLRNYWIFATNLGFDFFGMFFGTEYISKFKFITRGSDLLCAKTYVKAAGFTADNSKGRDAITFLDTMNYAKLSVKDMGKIIKIPKIEYKNIGQSPTNEIEWQEMREYNMNDALISMRFAKFLEKSIIELGGDMKITLASCSLKLFKNKYLTKGYFVHRKDILLKIFKAYFGGRTEVFKRGSHSRLFYHDINSMYPFVMRQYDFPDPNSVRTLQTGEINVIMDFEGVSFVKIHCPNMKYPLLPLRYNDRVIFPIGDFEGYYSHLELREALKLGYKIKEIGETVYYMQSCRPFSAFVDDLYKKRQEYKVAGSPMEYVCKILMNCLYGKFGQRFENMREFKHKDLCDENDMLNSNEQIGDYVLVKKDKEPSCFSMPIWAVYVTAYARLELYKYISISDPIYCDTDSIICKNAIENSKILGHLKIEYEIDECIFIRPKMYAIRTAKEDIIKCKGVNVKGMKYEDFFKLIDDFKVEQKRFVKFKTAIRRSLIPNEIITILKEYDIEDQKRQWKEPFNKYVLQDSEPINIRNDIKIYI